MRLRVVLVAGFALLSGCCANNVCDCDDARADAIELRFALGGPQGFVPQDLDTITLRRYPLPYDPLGKFESVTLYQTPGQVQDSILLTNNVPFSQSGSTKLNAYRYVVQYLKPVPGRKPVPTDVAVLDRVQLAGTLDADACCTCYTNTEKAVFLNGSTSPIDLRQRNQLLLTKP